MYVYTGFPLQGLKCFIPVFWSNSGAIKFQFWSSKSWFWSSKFLFQIGFSEVQNVIFEAENRLNRSFNRLNKKTDRPKPSKTGFITIPHILGFYYLITIPHIIGFFNVKFYPPIYLLDYTIFKPT